MNFRFSIFDFRALARRANVWRRLKEAEARATRTEGQAEHWEECYWKGQSRLEQYRVLAERFEKLAGEQREKVKAKIDECLVLCEQVRKAEGDLLVEKERVGVLSEIYEAVCEAVGWEGEDAKLLIARIEVLNDAPAAYLRRPAIVMETKQTKARKDLDRLMVLAGRAESDPLWQTILSYADEHEQTEREAALKPEPYPGRPMTDGERHYNAGRAASAYDFATALRDLFVEAQVEARKLKSES